ncbi:BTAD domain-containing putative transcriptional regulator [Actinoplanes sp. Pm04-4]|uniref:BTAD domain-containing putative transcriptional regulator n=1 Tax=Paractinoplanes pyxinae TaxID=2997416 RepID=A0ABT4ATK3_9ACTN|nr:BTAD domain-containing putative transcriptional regulator [Actinoplanes pyxinae]MCY1137507.1 BTAD domain-containing putative transcriptional regulator [Actinoplanes pyxinae]
MTNDLRVCVLGPVRAWLGGSELDLGPARQRAVFAVLAAHAGRVVGRDELITAIWGDSPPATAVGSIYTYVSGLRRVLDPENLSSGSGGYQLRVESGDLDSARFQRLRAAAAELLTAGDAAAAIERLDEALTLWRGDAYANLAGPFLELDRQRLAELRLAAAEQRARLMLEAGGDDGLIAELTALVRDHPLHEPLHELLMRALHRAGRHGEALEVFRTARRTLVAELGIEPGPALRSLHRQLLSGSADRGPARPSPDSFRTVVPTPIAKALRDGLGGRSWVGRVAEIDHLRGLVRAVAAGAGGAVWISGEPGIGKTELLTHAFADAARFGCRVAWGAADQLGSRVPLQVLSRALGLETASRRPQETEGPAEDQIVAAVRSACATSPLVLVVDDMQWADSATVRVWERLLGLVGQLPLLLVAAARPDAHQAELRRRIRARQQMPLDLGPLAPADLDRLVTALVGAPPGPNLREVAARSGGNPLFARELVAALRQRDAVEISGGRADIGPEVTVEPPPTLLDAVHAALDVLSSETREVLRLAALLGSEFSVSEVVAVTGRSALDLVGALEEALAAAVLVDSGTDLAFRHPFLRQALVASVPPALRAGLHRHAAEVLAAGGSPLTRVAEQLNASAPLADSWVLNWLVTHHAAVVRRAPQIAGDLIRRTLATDLPSAEQRATLLVALVRLEYRHGRVPLHQAEEAMSLTSDPGDRAEMRQLLATMRHHRGETAEAEAMLHEAVDDERVPEIWRSRHRVLLANFRRGDLDDLDAAERRATVVYNEAVAAGQPYETAFALQTIWLTSSIRRDHERALEHVDRALNVVRGRPELAGTYVDLLDNRLFSLQNLDRLDEAQETLRTAPAGLQVATAVQDYWLGRWDEALAEVGAVTEDGPGITFHGQREPGAVTMLLHGVAALIALHRGARDLAAAHLGAADAVPASEAERENCDFLLVARALAAEQRNRPDEALDLLGPLLQPAYAPMMLRHQWLPDVLRLARRHDRPEVADQAAAICATEAAREVRPARAYAANLRCQALLHGDPAPALAAAAHYRKVGRTFELAAALEDAAVLSGERPEEARRLYASMSARWDVARTSTPMV